MEASARGGGDTDDTEGDEYVDAADLSAWGMVAARLGNKGNRSAFRSAFWFDVTDRRTKQRIPGTAPRMFSRLEQWRDGTTPHRTWQDARRAFHRAQHWVDEILAERRSAQARLARLPVAIAEESELAAQADRLRADSAAVLDASRAQAEVLQRADADHAKAAEVRRRHLETKPGVVETLFTAGRAAREWRATLTPLEDQLRDAEVQRDRARSDTQRLDKRAQQLRERSRLVDKARALVEQEVEELRRATAADRETLRDGYPDERWTGVARELRAPWLDARLDEARSELFLAALKLHEEFLANAAGDMINGLRAAMDVVAGIAPRRLEPEKVRAAWQTFFLAVPMASTTFASFGRLFAGLGPESLGWLLIDEAGQASPQYAVGAIWRSQRVIAVGDPLQLQPVVTMPQKAQRDIASAYGVSPTWIPPRASVQTLADRVARHGTELRQGEELVWVSAPLTVHRRCDEPMFSLCNEIAYNGIMVSGVSRSVDDPAPSDLFDGPNGPRIASSRWLDEPALTAGSHLQPNQIVRLRRALERLQRDGVTLDKIIAISPFRAVADELDSLRKSRYPGLKAGTIHTAQGREADVVFLVLGGDPGAPGAKIWASSTVNLVNVAASRAKRRLYVIGDRATWGRYTYFRQLSEALLPGAGRPTSPAE